MDSLKDLSGPTAWDDWSFFTSGGVTENGKVFKWDNGKMKAYVGGVVGSDIFRIALIDGQLLAAKVGKSNCRQTGQSISNNICLDFYVLYISRKLRSEEEMSGLLR